jgi:hypothetical protein
MIIGIICLNGMKMLSYIHIGSRERKLGRMTLRGMRICKQSPSNRSQIVLRLFFYFVASIAASSISHASSASSIAATASQPDLATSSAVSARSGAGSAGELPQNPAQWRFPHTQSRLRLSMAGGLQAGGPIRYNTRFPEAKSDPHPPSYFHAPSFVSAEIEYALKYGSILVGVVTRRDEAHNGIKSRTAIHDGQVWRVGRFKFTDTGAMLGWVFGEPYREAWWTADFTLIYDRGRVDSDLAQVDTFDVFPARVNISALSWRSRLNIGVFRAGNFQVSLSPEIHVPLWYKVLDQSDTRIRPWVADTVQLKGSAALGLGVRAGFSF